MIRPRSVRALSARPSHRARRPLPSNDTGPMDAWRERFQPTLLHVFIYTFIMYFYMIQFYIF